MLSLLSLSPLIQCYILRYITLMSYMLLYPLSSLSLFLSFFSLSFAKSSRIIRYPKDCCQAQNPRKFYVAKFDSIKRQVQRWRRNLELSQILRCKLREYQAPGPAMAAQPRTVANSTSHNSSVLGAAQKYIKNFVNRIRVNKVRRLDLLKQFNQNLRNT